MMWAGRHRSSWSDGAKENRKKYFNSLVQPYRNGELSKEYCDAYPELAKKNYGDSAVSEAKDQWGDVEGFETRGKSL